MVESVEVDMKQQSVIGIRPVIDHICFLLARLLFPFVFVAARVGQWIARPKTVGKQHIVILSDHRLGDTIHLVPLFEALRRAFPASKSHIAVVVQSSVEPLVRKMPWFDEVISGDALERHPLLWLLHGVLWKAACRRVDILVDPVRLRAVGHDWLHKLWHPSISVAFDSHMAAKVFPFCSQWQKRHGDKMWTHLVPTALDRPVAESFQAFVDAIVDNETKVNLAYVWRFSETKAPGENDSGKDMVVLVPGSQANSRRWPIEAFRKVIEALLAKRPDLHFMVVGSPSEAALGEMLADGFRDSVENLCGKTNLCELADILAPSKANTKIVVSNDTGAAHLAAIQRTQTIVLLGGGEFGALFPAPERKNVLCMSCNWGCFRCGWRCNKADLSCEVAPCIAAIRPEDVVKATERQLLGE